MRIHRLLAFLLVAALAPLARGGAQTCQGTAQFREGKARIGVDYRIRRKPRLPVSRGRHAVPGLSARDPELRLRQRRQHHVDGVRRESGVSRGGTVRLRSRPGGWHPLDVEQHILEREQLQRREHLQQRSLHELRHGVPPGLVGGAGCPLSVPGECEDEMDVWSRVQLGNLAGIRVLFSRCRSVDQHRGGIFHQLFHSHEKEHRMLSVDDAMIV